MEEKLGNFGLATFFTDIVITCMYSTSHFFWARVNETIYTCVYKFAYTVRMQHLSF